jgi:hypothetical protein
MSQETKLYELHHEYELDEGEPEMKRNKRLRDIEDWKDSETIPTVS